MLIRSCLLGVAILVTFASTARGDTTCQTLTKRSRATHWTWVKLRRRHHFVRYHGQVVYVRVRRPYTRVTHERVCTTTVEPPMPAFHATVTLGPFVQSAQNPLSGTIAYGVSTTRAINGVTTPNAEAEGVLSLYVSGRLACSINASGATTTAECPITLPEPGEYPVILTYAGGGSGDNTTSETIKVGGA